MEIEETLEILEQNGYEAYIVGGYVRDYLLGIESTDVDIITNAKVKDILPLFTNINAFSDFYGNVKIITNHYNFDITTYRREIYTKEHILEIEYVDNLLEDLKRRDFVINTLCMTRNKQIIDMYEGQKDLKNKIIRMVGDADRKLLEDPTRALRAIRLACTLNFSLDEDLSKALQRHKSLVNTIPLEKVKEELIKILTSKNVLYGLSLLKELGYAKELGIYYDKVVAVDDCLGMWSQLTLTKEYPMKREEKETINKIKKILEKGTIDKDTLFDNGLYICLVAGSILGISKELITQLNSELPIQTIKDIKMDSSKICEILNIKPCKIIKDVYNDLKKMIINNIIKNESHVLEEYIISNKGKWFNADEIDKNSSFKKNCN